MARTIKDMPFWLWQAERLGKPYPENYSTAAWYETGDWPLDPAVRSQKARRKSAQEDRRIQHQRYRTYVRGKLAQGDYDGIEAPAHLTGWLWWW